ncbi:VOC family protein [Ideonella sp. DXS29W]|uniref:VOC family protein n=1 Tax=Ideonella lacteola TaxID=2984193 RepID=A0ABU9BHT8_9BURK
MKLQLDHITVAALDLAEGVAWAQERLGVAIPPGGVHPLMGTHNHLMRLGEGLFLEVIAPQADTRPGRPRWFALDSPAARAELSRSPRLWTWVAGCSSLHAALGEVAGAAGPAVQVSRGTLTWRIGVSDDGAMPFDGAFPTLIEWPEGPHPSGRMADAGCTLRRLTIQHPRAEQLAGQLAPHLADPRVVVEPGDRCRLTAELDTPQGPRTL